VKSVIAEDLVKTYRNGAVRALDHLSLDVEEGTVLSVLGPNGAGKTTCVRILATLLKPDSGRAMVGGIDVIKHPEKVREVIGLSGQYAAVDEILTGWDNLASGPLKKRYFLDAISNAIAVSLLREISNSRRLSKNLSQWRCSCSRSPIA